MELKFAPFYSFLDALSDGILFFLPKSSMTDKVFRLPRCRTAALNKKH